jgi:hypothetical protein
MHGAAARDGKNMFNTVLSQPVRYEISGSYAHVFSLSCPYFLS